MTTALHIFSTDGCVRRIGTILLSCFWLLIMVANPAFPLEITRHHQEARITSLDGAHLTTITLVQEKLSPKLDLVTRLKFGTVRDRNLNLHVSWYASRADRDLVFAFSTGLLYTQTTSSFL